MLTATLLLGLTLQTSEGRSGGFPMWKPMRKPQDLVVNAAEFPSVFHLMKEVDLPDLSRQNLPLRDIELRVWSGFSWGTSGFILRLSKGVWSARRTVAFQLPGENRYGTKLNPVDPPRRGWGAFWNELDALGVRTIPNEASLPGDGVRIMDGMSYLFEIRTGTAYRAYFYNNPGEHPKKPYAPAVEHMAEKIRRELPPRPATRR